MADDATTPTRDNFSSGAPPGQKPLPTSPFLQAVQIPQAKDESSLPRPVNWRRLHDSRRSENIEMDESEGDAHIKDEPDASDHESENADTKANNKKKSQRFYCTGYPPCTLSFTRSEHLARHIRKHTGERPFQCHCSRRFSRLDNLRQHAQTVHVNENIPIDSLAATGARFPRQSMKPERVRQATGRARASTGGGATGVARGHSKSLSTSSISSIGSTLSTRDRPPPLVVATDPRTKITLEAYGGTRDGAYPQYRPVSPNDFSTPTSATFSTGQNSPRWSGFASPTSSHSRSQSMYTESRTPNRRLSVPASGNNPFQAPLGINVSRPSFGPGAINASNLGAFPSATSSLLSSPTLQGPSYSRRDSISSDNEEAWRRRTWHPDSQNFHPTRLSNVSMPGHYDSSQNPPLAEPNHRTPSVRLPGIESFDPPPHRPRTPPKRNPSPMIVDSEASSHSSMLPAPSSIVDHSRNLSPWDVNLPRGLTRLEITPTSTGSNNPKGAPLSRESTHGWENTANLAVQAQVEQVRLSPPAVRFDSTTPSYTAANAPAGLRSVHHHTMSAPSISVGRDHRRHGWYNGPLQTHTEETRTTRIGKMVHPNMNGFAGFPGRHSHMTPHQHLHETSQRQAQEHPENPERLRGLDALVAVATSGGNTAEAY